MAIKGSELVKQYVETLSGGFHCREYDGANYLVVGTPYLYPDNDGISLYVEELPDGRIQVSDGGETSAYLFLRGIDLSLSPRGRAIAQDIAFARVVDFTGGKLNRAGRGNWGLCCST